MTNCVRSNNSRIVTQINGDQFLVEGQIDFARFGFEYDESSLNYVDIDNGPFLQVGKDFFGKGSITNLEKISTEKKDYVIIKVTIKGT